MRDFSTFDIMFLHLKLQTCFVLPGLSVQSEVFKNSIKIERIRDIESRIQNTTIPMYSLETRKIKKIYIKTLNARELVILL